MRKPMQFFEPVTEAVSRRKMLRGAGGILGAGAGMAAMATTAAALPQNEQNDPAGLWAVVVSSPDNSFPAFPAFELWGDGTFIGSGQPDLTPAALGSSAWGRWTKVADRQFHLIARFWNYTPAAVPTGFAGLDFTYTLTPDGKQYHAVGTTQFYDLNGIPLGPALATHDDGVRIA